MGRPGKAPLLTAAGGVLLAVALFGATLIASGGLLGTAAADRD